MPARPTTATAVVMCDNGQPPGQAQALEEGSWFQDTKSLRPAAGEMFAEAGRSFVAAPQIFFPYGTATRDGATRNTSDSRVHTKVATQRNMCTNIHETPHITRSTAVYRTAGFWPLQNQFLCKRGTSTTHRAFFPENGVPAGHLLARPRKSCDSNHLIKSFLGV